jgi:NAD(P)H-flavin reductase
MNTYDTYTIILSNEKVAEDHYLLRCECSEIAQHALPGQFVHVMIHTVLDSYFADPSQSIRLMDMK